MNHKVKKTIDQFFKTRREQVYNYKGEDYTINRSNFEELDSKLKQSFTHYASSQIPKRPNQTVQPKMSEQKSGPIKMPTKFPSMLSVKETKMINQVRKELIRIATIEKIVEEKLHYPSVFKALLSQPHTALDQFKKTTESELNLTLFIDTNVYYFREISNAKASLPHTIIQAVKGIKGINVFSSGALYDLQYKGKTYRYYTELLADLPEKMKQKVMVLTQGCGESDMKLYDPLKKGIIFCTPYYHGGNCGCRQIWKAEKSGKCEMHYDIKDHKSLKNIK